jgi:hypothetical protein
MVATAFIHNPDPINKTHVNHINGIRSDCRAVNLEWTTPLENNQRRLFKSSTTSTVRNIIQYTSDKKYVGHWRSIVDASKSISYVETTFNNYIDKDKTCEGFYWRYKLPDKIETETWRFLLYDGNIFIVSNIGRLITKDGRITYGSISSDGYYKYKDYKIHRLIMLSFQFRPDYKELVVDHISNDKKLNLLENLRWCTVAENNMFAGYTKKGKSNNHNKPVIQFLKKENGEEIEIDRFESYREAERKTGISSQRIGEVCSNIRDSYGGFFWKNNKE